MVVSTSPSTSSRSTEDVSTEVQKHLAPPRCESPTSSAPCSPEGTCTTAVVKPFFIMDWLEQVDPENLRLAQQMLQTPEKPKDGAGKETVAMTNPVRQDLFDSSNKRRSPTAIKSKPTTTTRQSPFRKRSIAIGNLWNAKGLEKAKRGRWEDALACWLNAAEIRSQVLGESHVDTANSCNNVGIAMGKLDRYDEGERYLLRALAIRTETFGREHVEVAATLHNIGNLLQQAGNLPSAIDCFEESKAIQENLGGAAGDGSDRNVQVARACIAIGHCYAQSKDYKHARAAYHDALVTFNRAGVSKENVEVQATELDLQELDNAVQRQGPQ